MSKKTTKFAIIISLALLVPFLIFIHHANAAGTQDAIKASNPSLADLIQNPQIQNAWKTILSLINYIIIIALIIIAFANILRIQIETYAIKKILPTLIIAILLANFSFVICTMILDLGAAVFNTIISIGAGKEGNFLAAAYKLTFPGWSRWLAGGGGTLLASGGITFLVLGFSWASLIGGLIVGLLLFFFPSIIFLIIWFLLIIRKFVVIVLVAISPLAFFSVGLPMTSQYFKMWWSTFLKWVFMPAAAFFIIALAMKIAPAIGSTSGNWGGAIQFAFMTGALILAVIVPFKLGGGITSAWASLGKLGGRILGKAPRTAGSLAESFGKVRTERLRAAGRLGAGQISTLERMGSGLKKWGSYADIGTYSQAGKKVWETMEEERRLEAEREIFGAPGIRKFIASDAAVSAAYRRRSKYREMSEPAILGELDRKRRDERLPDLSDANLSRIKNGANWVDINAAIAELAFRENILRQRGRPAAQDILNGLQALGVTRSASHEALQEFKPQPFGKTKATKTIPAAAVTSAKTEFMAQAAQTAAGRALGAMGTAGVGAPGLISLAETQKIAQKTAAASALKSGVGLTGTQRNLLPELFGDLKNESGNLDLELNKAINIIPDGVNIDKSKIINTIKSSPKWEEVRREVVRMITESTIPKGNEQTKLIDNFDKEFKDIHNRIQNNMKLGDSMKLEVSEPVRFSLTPVLKEGGVKNIEDLRQRFNVQEGRIKENLKTLAEGKGSTESIDITKKYLTNMNVISAGVSYNADNLRSTLEKMQRGNQFMKAYIEKEGRKGTTPVDIIKDAKGLANIKD